MKKLLFILILGLAPSIGYALGTPTTGVVQYVGTYGDGKLFIEIDREIQESGCDNIRFDIPAGHPSIDSWLSIAMVSATTGKPITVRTTGCLGQYPTIDETPIKGYVFLKKEES